MRQISLLVLFLAPALCLGMERFFLDYELLTEYGDSGSISQSLTGHTYDTSGNRIQSRVWKGTDSAASPISVNRFAYDTLGNTIQELLLSGDDTSAIVRYAYSGGVLHAIHTLEKDGTLRYTDTILYDGQGNFSEEQRIVSGVKQYFHRYTRNAHGQMVKDSLYEKDSSSSSYVAEQMYLFAYNPDSTIASESVWRIDSGSWYCVSTSFMHYASGSLVSVATHDSNGVGTDMTDSVAYTYDAHGNRTKEENYDGTKSLTYKIVYTWRDTEQKIAFMGKKSRADQSFVVTNKQGRLSVDCALRDRSEISIYDMTGKRLCRLAVNHSGTVPLQGLIGKGSFIAVFTVGSSKQVLAFQNFD